MVARVDTAGMLLWKVDTGIDRFRLEKILPDARIVAFVGTLTAVLLVRMELSAVVVFQ